MSVPSLVEEVYDPITKQSIYKWKTDLLASQKFWTGKNFSCNYFNQFFRMVYWFNEVFFINKNPKNIAFSFIR